MIRIIRIFLARLILNHKIKVIAKNLRYVNNAMLFMGWDRQRRREYWRDIVTITKKFW